MNKLSFKDILTSLITVVLAVGGFIAGTPQVSAEIPGRQLTAGLVPADLSGIISKYPTLFGIVLIVLIIVGIGYGIYYLVKRKGGK